MEIIRETFENKDIPYIGILDELYPDEKIMMFDIETTGLSPDRSFIYMIGINLREDGKWQTLLLFNDDGRSEPAIIKEFQEILSRHTVLIDFNGEAFDINFVKRRMQFIQSKMGMSITDHFRSIKNVDLMKMIRPYKYALGLPNIKQKTIERYLGLDRIDKYNGGQLIDIYLSYISDRNPNSKHLCIQHNRDDMFGMMHLSLIFNIESVSKGLFDISKIETEVKNESLYLIIGISLKHPLPRPIFSSLNGVSFDGEGMQAVVKASVINDTMKYYYASSKESFEEKRGFFISQLSGNIEKVPAYKNNYKDKISYIEICDSFLGNPEYIKSYVTNAADIILKNKK